MSSLRSTIVASLAIALLIGCTAPPQPVQDAATPALLGVDAQRPQGNTSYRLMKQGVGIGLAQIRCDAEELLLFLLGAGRGFCPT